MRTNHLGSLEQLGQHNNYAAVFLPDHSPEVIDRVAETALSGDVTALRIVLDCVLIHLNHNEKC